MTITPQDAARILDTCSAGIVVVGILIAGTRSIGRAIWLVAAQAILLSGAVAAVGVATGSAHVVLGGLLTLASRGVAVPLALRYILRQSPVRQERNPYLGPRASMIAAIAIVFVSTMAIDGGALGGSLGSLGSIGGSLGASVDSPRALPASVAEVLTGLLIVMTRRKGLSIVVGLLVFENGLALTAFSLTYGMPFVVELGATFDLLMVVVVLGVYARRMLTVFGSLSTDQLRNLRG
jgi:hydrogenase-4 component E